MDGIWSYDKFVKRTPLRLCSRWLLFHCEGHVQDKVEKKSDLSIVVPLSIKRDRKVFEVHPHQVAEPVPPVPETRSFDLN